MRDFDDVVRESVAAREAALGTARPGPGLAGTVAAIRRRRRRRHAGEAFAAVSAAAALVVVLVVGDGHGSTQHPVAPTGTPGPSATAAPTPTATPEPTWTPRPPRSVDELRAAGFGLPEVLVPVTDEVWARAGEGWLLVVARPTRVQAVVRNSLVLVSPQGASYLAAELPTDVQITLQHWEPGAERALVTIEPVVHGFTATGTRGWLDLRTGEVATDPGGLEPRGPDPATPRFVGIDHRGREVWIEHEVSGDGTGAGSLAVVEDGAVAYRLDLGADWGTLAMDPNARTLLVASDRNDGYRAVDLDTGSVQTHTFGDRCDIVGWTAQTHVLVVCEPESDGGGGVPFSDLADLRVGDDHVTPLPASDRYPVRGPGAWLAGQGSVVPYQRAYGAADEEPPSAAAAFAQDGSSTVLPIPLDGHEAFAATRSADGRAYVEVWGPSDDWSVSSWDGQEVSLLVQIPRGSGTTSWIVAGDQDGPR